MARYPLDIEVRRPDGRVVSGQRWRLRHHNPGSSEPTAAVMPGDDNHRFSQNRTAGGFGATLNRTDQSGRLTGFATPRRAELDPGFKDDLTHQRYRAHFEDELGSDITTHVIDGFVGGLEDAIEPTDFELHSGWSNAGPPPGFFFGFGSFRYWRSSEGMVFLDGLVKPASSGANGGVGDPIFTLPEGYRPSHSLIFPVIKGDSTFHSLTITANGRIQHRIAVGTGTADDFITLSGICFKAEN